MAKRKHPGDAHTGAASKGEVCEHSRWLRRRSVSTEDERSGMQLFETDCTGVAETSRAMVLDGLQLPGYFST